MVRDDRGRVQQDSGYSSTLLAVDDFGGELGDGTRSIETNEARDSDRSCIHVCEKGLCRSWSTPVIAANIDGDNRLMAARYRR